MEIALKIMSLIIDFALFIILVLAIIYFIVKIFVGIYGEPTGRSTTVNIEYKIYNYGDVEEVEKILEDQTEEIISIIKEQ